MVILFSHLEVNLPSALFNDLQIQVLERLVKAIFKPKQTGRHSITVNYLMDLYN